MTDQVSSDLSILVEDTYSIDHSSSNSDSDVLSIDSIDVLNPYWDNLYNNSPVQQDIPDLIPWWIDSDDEDEFWWIESDNDSFPEEVEEPECEPEPNSVSVSDSLCLSQSSSSSSSYSCIISIPALTPISGSSVSNSPSNFQSRTSSSSSAPAVDSNSISSSSAFRYLGYTIFTDSVGNIQLEKL